MSTIAARSLSAPKQSIEELFDAMHHGKWRFSDFAEMDVSKNVTEKSFYSAGKSREIRIPSEKLRGAHDFLRLFLLNYLPINAEIVFSYRKGLSAYDAVVKHSSSKIFLTCDIGNFFPSIKRHRIKSTLAGAIEASPIRDLEVWLDRITDMVCLNNELPMGFSTSPTISNSVLMPFDNELQSYCAQNNLHVTRYSDDIIVSSEKSIDLGDVESQIAMILGATTQNEISLNIKKTKILAKGRQVKLLGMVLLPNGSISIDAEIKSEIEVLIHFYLHDKSKFTDRAGGDFRQSEARLSGLLNYANAIDQGYLDKLRKKFGVTIVDYFFHRSFS